MKKIALTTLMVAVMALALQPLMANAEEAYEYAEETYIEEPATDADQSEEAVEENSEAESADEQESYEDNQPD